MTDVTKQKKLRYVLKQTYTKHITHLAINTLTCFDESSDKQSDKYKGNKYGAHELNYTAEVYTYDKEKLNVYFSVQESISIKL